MEQSNSVENFVIDLLVVGFHKFNGVLGEATGLVAVPGEDSGGEGTGGVGKREYIFGWIQSLVEDFREFLHNM